MRRALIFLCVSGCVSSGFQGTDAELAEQLAKSLAAACPIAAADDEMARSLCAANLTDLGLMRDNMASPFLWGQQQDAGIVDTAAFVTRFHPLVYRRLYLSLYMFPAQHSVEKLPDGRTLLRVAAKFRNKLDMGSYPYPFWHSARKWGAYQMSNDLIFIVKDGKLQAALRSAEGTEPLDLVPPRLPEVVHDWGGQWSWALAGQEYPQATLYTWLLSSSNPHRAALEEAYRDLEHAMRQSSCFMCHQPDNAGQMKVLELFSYPNQALTGRHRIVQQLENNLMPYPDPARGIHGGFTEAEAGTRTKLLELANKFAQRFALFKIIFGVAKIKIAGLQGLHGQLASRVENVVQSLKQSAIDDLRLTAAQTNNF